MYSLNLLKGKYWKFPGSPVTKTPHVYCMGSSPGQGIKISLVSSQKKENIFHSRLRGSHC